MPEIRITTGQVIRTRGGWYRHDTVTVDGKQLDGFMQVRRRNKRTESITCYRDACVLGHDVAWLQRVQGDTHFDKEQPDA